MCSVMLITDCNKQLFVITKMFCQSASSHTHFPQVNRICSGDHVTVSRVILPVSFSNMITVYLADVPFHSRCFLFNILGMLMINDAFRYFIDPCPKFGYLVLLLLRGYFFVRYSPYSVILLFHQDLTPSKSPNRKGSKTGGGAAVVATQPSSPKTPLLCDDDEDDDDEDTRHVEKHESE